MTRGQEAGRHAGLHGKRGQGRRRQDGPAGSIVAINAFHLPSRANRIKERA
jgi:hypothetical protein